MPNRKTSAQLQNELLWGMSASSYFTFLGQYLQSLPQYIDDAQRDFGFDLYERMLKDPVLESSIRALKIAILSQGPKFIAAASAPTEWSNDPAAQARYDKAEEIRAFIERMCDRLQEPLENILSEMLDALAYGYAVAEKVYEFKDSKLVLKTLRVKPRKNFAFVVDKFMSVIGLLGASDDTLGSVPSISSNVADSDVLPRDKFLVWTHNGKNGDPRGSSLLRSAYNAWYLKQQTWPHYLKFLAQFGTPSLVGKLPENATDVAIVNADGSPLLDEDGNPTVLSPEQAMLQQLLAFSNGTAIVLPFGAEHDLIESKGGGEAFTNAIDLYDRQMTRGILIAIRATMESQHGSKADSGTAQDVLADYTQMIQRQLEVAFYRDVIYPTVVINFGQEVADDVCPYMSLSDVAREDVVNVGNMIANLARANMIHSSQYTGIDAKLNLPERDIEAQMEEEAEARDQAQMLKGLMTSGEKDASGKDGGNGK